MTINEFYRKCAAWYLTEELEHEVKENYDFFIKLGYTHNQSLILAVCDFNYSSYKWIDIFKKAHDLQKNKLKKVPLSDIVVKHIESLESIMPEDNVTQDLFRTDGMPPIRGAIAPVPPPPLPQPPAHHSGGLFSMFKKQRRSSTVNYSITSPHAPSIKTKQVSHAAMPQSLQSNAGFDCDEGVMEAEMCYSVAPAPVFKEASVGGYSLDLMGTPVNMADTESYEHIEEKGFQNVSDNPTSTFRTTCNTASMGILMNNIRKGRAVKPSSIRMEELMNFFDYELKANDDLLNINIEMCDKPYSKNKLLFIGVKGKVITPEKQNINILLDVSGSMSSNSINMIRTIAAIVKRLNVGDKFSIVTYSTKDHTIIEGMEFDGDLDKIIEKLFDIYISGYTNGSKGIETSYKIAANNFIKDGANKVILITDGDLNFGINSNDGLKNLILEKKKTGVFLSVIGMGIGNYKDDKLETLAKNGNGNYCVINTSHELEDIVVKNYEQIIFSIAKDVKAQVEFNPALIKSYRLLGYENREISHSDFNNDEVIAEPFGSGATCVALYEVELADGNAETAGLKYQKPVLTDSKEYCTVSVRYKLPMADTSELISKPLDHIGEMTTNLKLAYICYAIAEKFRESDKADLKDELFARYLAETMKDDEIEKLNGDKIELLKFLSK